MHGNKTKAFKLANKIASEFGDYSKILANKTMEKMDKKIENGIENAKKKFKEFNNLGDARRTTKDEEDEFQKLMYGKIPSSKPVIKKVVEERMYNNNKQEREEEPVFKIVKKNEEPKKINRDNYYKPYNNVNKKNVMSDEELEDIIKEVKEEGDSVSVDEALDRLLKKMHKKVDDKGEYYEFKKSSLGIEKTSSIERRDMLRGAFKKHIDEEVSTLENGKYFHNNDLKLPDYKDPFVEEKINMLKKKISDGLFANFDINGSITNLYNSANSARALDINGRNKIRAAVKEEAQMAQRAFNDYLDRRLPDLLEKHLKSDNMQRLKDEEEKYKDTFSLQEGGIAINEGKKINVNSLAGAVTDNKALENFTVNSMPYKNNREEEKVKMLSSILRANKPQLIIR